MFYSGSVIVTTLCLIMNVGTKPVTIASVGIVNPDRGGQRGRDRGGLGRHDAAPGPLQPARRGQPDGAERRPALSAPSAQLLGGSAIRIPSSPSVTSPEKIPPMPWVKRRRARTLFGGGTMCVSTRRWTPASRATAAASAGLVW